LTQDELVTALRPYFPGSFSGTSDFLQSSHGSALVERLMHMPRSPLTRTHLNQFLHLSHEAGVTDGFFAYYFLTQPTQHPYAIDRVLPTVPGLNEQGVSSVEQMRWGLHRFFIDALLYFGDLRTAFRELRKKSYVGLQDFFASKRFDSEAMRARGPVLPFHPIPADDRYLIAEIACKAYSPLEVGQPLLIENLLLEAYRQGGGGRIQIKDLFDKETILAKSDPQAQMMLEFTTVEFAEDTVDSEDGIRTKVRAVADRFERARTLALRNTRLYLSIVNELDVYVATSMRRRSDFRDMARDCESIFRQDGLTRFRVRFFDPTMSATDGHEDKGLVECLMVKCAKALVYFAGESDSFGKDAEVSMALSLGKPVIILCPASTRGEQRMKFFRDTHPLSRMVHMESGVPVGAMVTNDVNVVARLIDRLFDNRMEYDLDHRGDGYVRIRERLTGSVVRLQTNDRMIRESFWNYYHGVE
jgi:hypothetical protein